MKFGVPEKDLKEILNEIKRNLGHTKKPKVYIYGSRVKGGYRKYSDIDIVLRAVDYDRNSLDLIDFKNLDTPYKVDFVLEPDLFEGYRDEILGHMIEL